MAGVVNIVLIENAFLLRAGLESLLQEIPGILIAEVFDGGEKNLFEKIKNQKPDAVIINPNALADNFLSLITKLQNENEIKLIGLMGDDCSEKVSSRFSLKLSLYGSKHNLSQQLMSIWGTAGSVERSEKGLLSKRELIVLKEVVKGLTNQEIADKLFLSIHTVMTHRKNVTKKLGIKTVSGLMVYVLMNNILDIKEIA